ncbi:leukocyte surface antigen CD53 [Wyeomyia smithii]|uniref:leukocyte surface antigen CD53 n=1 Tax=Wyeomyia smithii TaxID=174621 RepID=UPI002467C072|nr:leukocyte surface antigen CD53 [Wyeomyia smithii]
MRLSARIKCFRYLVYAYVVLISICGGAQLVIGAFLLWTHQQYSTLVNDQFWQPFVVLIALGLVSQLLCYLGWTATSKKHRCYLGTFCAFLVILIVTQFLISGWAIATKTQLITPAELAIEANFGQFIALNGASKDQTHIWNRLQRDLQCCGFNGIHDYKKVGVPWSCYDPINSKVYSVGCMHSFVRSIEVNMVRVAIVAIAAALIQSLGIFCVIQLVMLLKEPKLMLPTGNNQSLRVKRTRELVPLSSEAATTSSTRTMASTIPTMTIHSSSSTKPPIATKPVVPKIEHPIIK